MKHNDELLPMIAPKDGRPPLEKFIGDTIDISEYLDSDFYDPVWYWDTFSGEKGKALPGRLLGISHIFCVGMCYWILNEQGGTLSRSMVQHVTKEYLFNSTLKETL